MFKFSVDVHGEYYARVGKGEKDNIDYKIEGLKVESVSQDMLPLPAREAAMEYIRTHLDRKATALRLFYIDSITKLGAVGKKEPEIVVKNLEDMDATELRAFAAKNNIEIDESLVQSTEDLLYIIQEHEEIDPEADKGGTAEEDHTEEETEELDDRGQPVKK